MPDPVVAAGTEHLEVRRTRFAIRDPAFRRSGWYRWYLGFSVVATLLLIVAAIAGSSWVSRTNAYSSDYANPITAGWSGWVCLTAALLGCVSIGLAWLQTVAYRDAKRDEERQTDATEAAGLLAQDLASTDYAALWTSTYRRLEGYHEEARSQLRTSYVIAQVVAGAGFVGVVILGISAAGADNGGAAAGAAVAATAGAAAAAYVAKTFQDSYSLAMEQRMSYFTEPVRMVRLLAAERLLSNLSNNDAAHAVAVQTIIAAAVAPPGSGSSSST